MDGLGRFEPAAFAAVTTLEGVVGTTPDLEGVVLTVEEEGVEGAGFAGVDGADFEERVFTLDEELDLEGVEEGVLEEEALVGVVGTE